MLKKLRVKFVLVIMGIVTVLFGTVFGYVMHQTKQNMERDSIQMMRTLTFRSREPGRKPDNMPPFRPDNTPGNKPEDIPEDMPGKKTGNMPEDDRNRNRRAEQNQIRMLFYTVRVSADGEILESEGNDSALSDQAVLEELTSLALAEKKTVRDPFRIRSALSEGGTRRRTRDRLCGYLRRKVDAPRPDP